MTQSVNCRLTARLGRAVAGAGLVLALCTRVPVAMAVDWGDDFQVHGFATQGFVETTDNRFFGDSDDGSFNFTELGINVSYRATPSLLLAGQLLSRSAGDMYDGSPTVDFAVADWTVSSDQESGYGIKLGRIKNPLGFYNETRDVAFTRPSIFLPQVIYFDAVRNLLLSSDGAHVYGRYSTDFGTWSFDVGAGITRLDENVEFTFLGNDFNGELEPRGLSPVARIAFETPDAAWRFALSGASTTMKFDNEPGDPIGGGEVDILYGVASAQYTAERWSLTAEYMQQPVEYDGFGPLLDGRDRTIEGYYLQGSYMLRNDLELIARYSAGFGDRTDRDGSESSAATFGTIPRHVFYQKDWMLGLRWDVTPSFMLRAEYQWNDGTGTLSRRENPSLSTTVRNWEMFSLLGSYRF